MPLMTTTSDDEQLVTIKIDGRFDFSVHREFREAYKGRAPVDSRFVVDLEGVEYMDSSALGMLLLLKEYSGGDNTDVTIINAGEDIRKILLISNFDKLFDIR